MPGNISPVYSRHGAIANSTVAAPTTSFPALMQTANAAMDAASGTVVTVFTADTTNGSFLRSIMVKVGGATAAATSAAVLRLFINNGAVTTTNTNNVLWKELTLPVVTPSATAPTPDYEIPANFLLPAGQRIIALISATQTTAGYVVFGIGGHL